MAEPRPTIPQQLNSSQVPFPFILRLVVLSTFATFGTRRYGTAFAGLLAMSAIFLRGRGRNAPRGDVWTGVDALG
jgi:hypothetical protein